MRSIVRDPKRLKRSPSCFDSSNRSNKSRDAKSFFKKLHGQRNDEGQHTVSLFSVLNRRPGGNGDNEKRDWLSVDETLERESGTFS